jgi:hypothetical protein
VETVSCHSSKSWRSPSSWNASARALDTISVRFSAYAVEQGLLLGAIVALNIRVALGNGLPLQFREQVDPAMSVVGADVPGC